MQEKITNLSKTSKTVCLLKYIYDDIIDLHNALCTDQIMKLPKWI